MISTTPNDAHPTARPTSHPTFRPALVPDRHPALSVLERRGVSRLRRVAPLTGLALLLAVVGMLAGCSAPEDAGAATEPAGTTAPSAGAATDTHGAHDGHLTVTDAWAKATDTEMTGVFGTLVNGSDADMRIVSATAEVAGRVELHEVVAGDDGAMVMQPKPGGFVVPAHGSHELVPGGDHLMLMKLTEEVLPGDDVTVILTTEDGSTVELVAPARSFSGAEESYTGHDGGDQ